MVFASFAELNPLGYQRLVNMYEIFTERTVIGKKTILGLNFVGVLFDNIYNKFKLFILFTRKKSFDFFWILGSLLYTHIIIRQTYSSRIISFANSSCSSSCSLFN